MSFAIGLCVFEAGMLVGVFIMCLVQATNKSGGP